MTNKKGLSKEDRVASETRRLNRLFKGIDEKKKKVAEGLIERAAHQRVTLEDLADDIDKNGMTEKFSQGDQEPYDRKRPAADLYNTMNTSYQKAVKQLIDLLPKDEQPALKDDGFNAFVIGRDDI